MHTEFMRKTKLLNALHKSHGRRKRQHFINDYVPYLPACLTEEDFSPNAAVLDIERLGQLGWWRRYFERIFIRQVGQTKNITSSKLLWCWYDTYFVWRIAYFGMYGPSSI